MASRDKVDVDMFHKSIQYALEKLGKSKSSFETTVVSKFKRKRRVGSGNEVVDYSRAPCLGADQKARGLWERDWRISRHSAHAQRQVWHIWLVLVSIYCVYKAIQNRNVVGLGQRSPFLVLTKRSAASGDENGVLNFMWTTSRACAESR